MVVFECDTCHGVREGQEEWILGRAAENIGAVSARREIAFEPEWNYDIAIEPLAVHFCSLECKDKFLKSFLGNNGDEERVTAIPKKASTRSARAAHRTRKRA